MLNSITNHSIAYAAYTAADTSPKVPAMLQKDAAVDVYQRSDGTTATRFDLADKPVESVSAESATDAHDKQFRELLHQFIGQTLFGQMLKSMRATQEKNPFFHGGQSEEIYQSMLDMELTDQMTKATSKTLSEPMYKLMKAPKMK
jgi:Rod binding domain-containing protein